MVCAILVHLSTSTISLRLLCPGPIHKADDIYHEESLDLQRHKQLYITAIELALTPFRSRRVNGATQTFRRPSLATSYSSSNQPQTREANIESQQPSARYVPVHKNGPISDLRYSKEQLLELAKAHIGSGAAQRDSLLSLTVSGWEPDHPNGAAERGNGWPRKDEHRDPSTSSEAFWEHDGSVIPRGLVDLTEDEREVGLRFKSIY